MARPSKPKTALAQRLLDVRGSRTRPEFSALLGINQHTYASYEAGNSEPNVAFLNLLLKTESLNANWLLSGEGSMRHNESGDGSADHSEVAQDRQTHEAFFSRVLDAVQKIHGEFGITLQMTELGKFAARKYDEYIAMASDPDDEEERIALMNLLRTRLRKELQVQNAAPGTDKATA